MTAASAMPAAGPVVAGAAKARAAVTGKAAGRRIRLLVFTGLYPNAVRPRHGSFVEERLRRLVATEHVAASVVAPVPWFPFRHRCFGRYAAWARVPACEERHGIRVMHPRYPVIPKLGMGIAPALMYRALLPVLRGIIERDGPFDLLDAHYFYPDGVAAARLGRALRMPVVITARGSDLNVIAGYRLPAWQIRRSAAQADAVVTVSGALRRQALARGLPAARLTVLRNGVDLTCFRPLERGPVRTALGLSGPVWLSVGNLVALKGVHVTLAALARVSDATLLVVGEGPEETRLRRLAAELGVAARVRFLGTRDHARLRDLYNAADATWLASSHEGMPNVVLESLACGTPVVAAPFASARELLGVPAAGEVAASRDGASMAEAWRRLQARHVDRADTRGHAETFGWEAVMAEQCALYARVLAARMAAMPRRGRVP